MMNHGRNSNKKSSSPISLEQFVSTMTPLIDIEKVQSFSSPLIFLIIVADNVLHNQSLILEMFMNLFDYCAINFDFLNFCF